MKNDETIKKDTTIYDIAKEANVSPATVSRVLTGSAKVKEDKKERVLEIIKLHNFQPNAVARSLFKKRSMMIGVILPDITNPFFSTVFLEAEKAALEFGYSMILCNSMDSSKVEALHIKSLSEKQVDGVIFMGHRVNAVKTNINYVLDLQRLASKIPFVIINGKMTGVDSYKIITDEEDGIIKIVDYLVALGHKDIAILGGITNSTSTSIKHMAYAKALKKYGIKVDKTFIVNEGFSIESGITAMEILLKGKKVPTAVIGINDLVAIGAIRAIKSAGIEVPKDISVTGFDGTYISELVSPQLTTVYQSYEDIGREAVNTIIDVIKNKETPKNKIIKTKLIIRKSCSTKP
ncbi:LacI family DNA-binding transcriptional regulator [Clostridium estertheticum]|uniref:LacI family DNA-binding transcriptional regulator n=1 Tax=Clostridium estertheticum TaxID=238834 RepID=UPI001CF44CC2|nr:LacI family DNA-binding transcriptional regulator [Clostridium estertheticum]MCB2354658.1 LacI family transcriptional regulator [Clostridium estertheticum]WAG40905.1 LacI family transcriptional regulator [Clostridium estertheticum]